MPSSLVIQSATLVLKSVGSRQFMELEKGQYKSINQQSHPSKRKFFPSLIFFQELSVGFAVPGETAKETAFPAKYPV